MTRRYLRYDDGRGPRWGELEGEAVHPLSAAPWEPHQHTGTPTAAASLRLLCPVAPSKIVLVGLNYRAHVAESKSADKVPDEPVIFLKPPTALLAPGAPIRRPRGVERVDYEAELSVVIGRTLSRPSPAEVQGALFAATCLNDVTARPLQRKDVQWTRAKGFDTFCPVGPHLVTGVDFDNLQVQSFVNGQPKQNGRTSDLIFSVATLVKFIADVMTLHPGDLVSTGTPEGVGPLVHGDTVEIRIEQVGSLTNQVIDAG
jgi:2-keto-4-pentenoate hydratase/2-oxohepta-3-ene-1,7-dioic acid hydratase in catechol pathway